MRPNDSEPLDGSTNPLEETHKSRLDGDITITRSRSRLFSSLLFGLLDPVPVDEPDVTLEKKSLSPVSTQPPSDLFKNKSDRIATTNDSKTVDDATPNNNVNGVLDYIDILIPHDPINLRQSTLYKGALQMLKWQRDNYFVGDEYADWRKNDRHRQHLRQRQQRYFTTPNPSIENYKIPYNAETISHHHISSLASNFIPTSTVKNIITPIVTGLFDKSTGVLYDPIKQNTINIILDQQNLLERTMKNQILLVLDNPRNRDAIKDSTQGMIIETARVDSQGVKGRES
jgi:hypothetical protein